MVKAIVYAISKVNDFKVLLLPNGEFAPMETTEKLHLEDEIFIQDFGLGGVTFDYNNEICTGFIEVFVLWKSHCLSWISFNMCPCDSMHLTKGHIFYFYF